MCPPAPPRLPLWHLHARWALLALGLLVAGSAGAGPALPDSAPGAAPESWTHGLITWPLALLLYHLVVSLQGRDTLYGRYTLALASFFVWNSVVFGLSGPQVWPDSLPGLHDAVGMASTLVLLVTLTLLAQTYLDLPRLTPRLWRVLQGVIGLQAVSVLVPVIEPHPGVWMWITALAVLGIGLLTMAAALLALSGVQSAWLWLLAWTALAAGGGLHTLGMTGVLPPHPLVHSALQIGAALAWVMVGIGLHQLTTQRHAHAHAAERASRASLTRKIRRLEEEALERTDALEEAARQLSAMALTDELTGAYNRRHFDEVLAHELTRRDRKTGFTLVLINLDHFKAYNDRHGPPAGDHALLAVARVTQALLRRSTDRFFRLSGGSFALIFGSEGETQSADFMDVLRTTVERIGLPHMGSPLGRVTISLGVLYLPPPVPPQRPLSADAAMAQAERLLRRAKLAGHNRLSHGSAERLAPRTQAA